MGDSEIEDIYQTSLYDTFLLETYNVDIHNRRFRTNEKWTQRCRAVFTAAGQPFGDRIEREVKLRIAELVATAPAGALNPHKRNSFDALVSALERKIERAAH